MFRLNTFLEKRGFKKLGDDYLQFTGEWNKGNIKVKRSKLNNQSFLKLYINNKETNSYCISGENKEQQVQEFKTRILNLL